MQTVNKEEIKEDEPPDQGKDWKQLLKESIHSPKTISEKFNLDEKEIKQVCDKYPSKINPYCLSLMKEKGDVIYKQYVPSIEEITDSFGEEDPLHEEPEHQSRKNVPSLITHRYPDRALFRISNQCATYCRFCTRKRKVGDPTKQPKNSEIDQALEYIKSNKEIRDVILSGGDPLILDDAPLEKIISEVHDVIKNRESGIIRLGTRIPGSLPQRITQELCDMLKKYHPLYISTHFNHPSEITYESEKACELLVNSGIPLGCQTVLLKGINDDPKIMRDLMLKLVSIRVKPYYIYQADQIKGANHFRTRVEKGLYIYSKLRGHISGLAVPTFVIDAPGGGGKIPILPDYTETIGDKINLKNYEGKIFEYIQVE